MIQLAFLVLAGMALIGAIGVVTARSVFVSALCLVLSLMGVAGLYITLDAAFLGVIQVLVYVGAISVLILFAVMLTPNLMDAPMQLNKQSSLALAVALLVFGALAALGFGTQWQVQPRAVLPGGGAVVVAESVPTGAEAVAGAAGLPYAATERDAGGAEVLRLPDPTVMLGKSFMSDQLLAFEVISVILLVALLGAIVIARD
jgi:NADH-quinone oxidoreductase subunit J